MRKEASSSGKKSPSTRDVPPFNLAKWQPAVLQKCRFSPGTRFAKCFTSAAQLLFLAKVHGVSFCKCEEEDSPFCLLIAPLTWWPGSGVTFLKDKSKFCFARQKCRLVRTSSATMRRTEAGRSPELGYD